MSKTIEGVPDYITLDEWKGMIEHFGFDPEQVIELRFAHNGIHALVLAVDEEDNRLFDERKDENVKHRVFVPVRKAEQDSNKTTLWAAVT